MTIVAWNGSGDPTAMSTSDTFKKVLSIFITASILKLGQGIILYLILSNLCLSYSQIVMSLAKCLFLFDVFCQFCFHWFNCFRINGMLLHCWNLPLACFFSLPIENNMVILIIEVLLWFNFSRICFRVVQLEHSELAASRSFSQWNSQSQMVVAS